MGGVQRDSKCARNDDMDGQGKLGSGEKLEGGWGGRLLANG